MQDGLDRLVIVNRNAKSKSNRDSKPRKSTDRKPIKLLKDPVVQRELKPGHSKWFPGDTRPDWTRPCFKDFEHVIIGDSQLKIYGQQKKEKKGFSITSFSGCDVSLIKFNLNDNNFFTSSLNFWTSCVLVFSAVKEIDEVMWQSWAELTYEKSMAPVGKGSNKSHVMHIICNIRYGSCHVTFELNELS